MKKENEILRQQIAELQRLVLLKDQTIAELERRLAQSTPSVVINTPNHPGWPQPITVPWGQTICGAGGTAVQGGPGVDPDGLPRWNNAVICSVSAN